MKKILEQSIDSEFAMSDLATARRELDKAFHHLERAHVLGQASTYIHTRVHWRMFKVALKMHSPREIWGQIIRIIGASTKTPFGIYPTGNTGGSDVWFFQRQPIPKDLQAIISDRN